MSKEYGEAKVSKTEFVSDEDVRLAIRYLDPEMEQNESEALACIAMFTIVLFFCAILVSLHFLGL